MTTMSAPALRLLTATSTCVLLVVALSIAAVIPAFAKGPTAVTIDSPGGETIELKGFAEPGAAGAMSELATLTGYWQFIGGTGSLPSGGTVLPMAPEPETLGEATVITWHLGDLDSMPFDLHRTSDKGTVVHIGAIISPYSQEPVDEVWFLADARLDELLGEYGVQMAEAVLTPAPVRLADEPVTAARGGGIAPEPSGPASVDRKDASRRSGGAGINPIGLTVLLLAGAGVAGTVVLSHRSRAPGAP